MGYKQNTNQKLPTLYELIDKDGVPIFVFDTSQKAAEFAAWRWPDQSQDEDRSGRGWDIQIAGAE